MYPPCGSSSFILMLSREFYLLGTKRCMKVSPNISYWCCRVTIWNNECDSETINCQLCHFMEGRIRVVDKSRSSATKPACDSCPCEVVSCCGLPPVSRRPHPGNAESSFPSSSSALEAFIFPSQNVSALVSRKGTFCSAAEESSNSVKTRGTAGQSDRTEPTR